MEINGYSNRSSDSRRRPFSFWFLLLLTAAHFKFPAVWIAVTGCLFQGHDLESIGPSFNNEFFATKGATVVNRRIVYRKYNDSFTVAIGALGFVCGIIHDLSSSLWGVVLGFFPDRDPIKRIFHTWRIFISLIYHMLDKNFLFVKKSMKTH